MKGLCREGESGARVRKNLERFISEQTCGDQCDSASLTRLMSIDRRTPTHSWKGDCDRPVTAGSSRCACSNMRSRKCAEGLRRRSNPNLGGGSPVAGAACGWRIFFRCNALRRETQIEGI